MKILVTGSNGQLGSDIVKQLKSENISVITADRTELDITKKDEVSKFFDLNKPDAVIHCAAYTNVDKAETEKELCSLINITGTENIASICKLHGIKLLYTSTDYVFDGEGDQPFQTDSPLSPCNHYGYTKLQGENIIKKICDKFFIVRISWVFGQNGKNFVKTMLRLSEEKEEISVVCDQIGSPTFTSDLSVLLCNMIMTDKYGIYHATNEEYCSWYDFAEEIMALAGKKTKIIPISTSEYHTAATRPLNSRLSKDSLDRAGFARLPSWKNALKRFLEQN